MIFKRMTDLIVLSPHSRNQRKMMFRGETWTRHARGKWLKRFSGEMVRALKREEQKKR